MGRELTSEESLISLGGIKIDDILPCIDGHQITRKEWIAFAVYTETSNGVEAAKAAGVVPVTVYKWRKTNWWDKLQKDIVVANQDRFYVKIAKNMDKAADSWEKIIEGNFPDPKMANAAVKAIELGMRMGKGGTEPILNSKPYVDVHQNIVNVTINLDKIQEVYIKMNDDEQREFHMYGSIPDKYKSELNAIEENIIDAEFEEGEG